MRLHVQKSLINSSLSLQTMTLICIVKFVENMLLANLSTPFCRDWFTFTLERNMNVYNTLFTHITMGSSPTCRQLARYKHMRSFVYNLQRADADCAKYSYVLDMQSPQAGNVSVDSYSH